MQLRRAYLDLFLISFLNLFFELAAIRWFAGTVVFLTFFTNIVLLACFLGMSVGLLGARRPQHLVQMALPMAMLAFAAAIAIHLLYWQWADRITISLGNQQASPQLIYFGTEYRPADPSRWIIPVWGVEIGRGLNSSHSQISYAVFCLKKKKKPAALKCNSLDSSFRH